MTQLQITLKTFKPNNFTIIDNLLPKLKNIKILKDIELKQIILPASKKKIFTVLKSPHVYKKSREQFKYSTYKRQILITNSKLSLLSTEKISVFII
jgi:small subunit ribosomal protein S10